MTVFGSNIAVAIRQIGYVIAGNGQQGCGLGDRGQADRLSWQPLPGDFGRWRLAAFRSDDSASNGLLGRAHGRGAFTSRLGMGWIAYSGLLRVVPVLSKVHPEALPQESSRWRPV